MDKPNALSCERNQQAILGILEKMIKPSARNLFEIGSGTGQHAVFMAPNFPKLQWHTSDLIENHRGINLWIDDSNSENISRPIIYQAGKTDFPEIDADVVFSTNTLHIMSWDNVKALIKQLGKHLKSGTQIFLYGPFNYNGQFTSKSNADFDIWLKQRASYSGIRDFEKIQQLMTAESIKLVEDIQMPANNRILYFVKQD
jgi:cyclopropane fatty-acyl-phospholipid synthase-like methyltransferase